MITVKLTTVSGNTQELQLPDKESVLMYIDQLRNALPKNATLQIDAPLAGISGWVRAKQ
jgi:hypothetical protein